MPKPRNPQRLPRKGNLITNKDAPILYPCNCSADKQDPDCRCTELPENDWEYIFQAIGSPTIILDPQYHILAANRATVEATGLSVSELIGKKCYHVFHSPQSQQPAKYCPMNKLLHSGKVETKEMEVEALNGTYLISCTPIFNRDNQLSRIIHIATPITEHKRIKQELELQNHYLSQLNSFALELGQITPDDNLDAFISMHLRKISGASGITLTTFDEKQRSLIVRHIELESRLLQKLNDLAGKNVASIPSPISQEVYDEIMAEQVGIKNTLQDASFGGVPPVASAAIGKLLNADRYIGLAYVCDNRLFGTSLLAMRKDTPNPPFDILRTFGHLAALALQRKQADEALKESEENYRLLIDNMNEGVVMVDIDDRILFVNPAACNIYGYEAENLIGKVSYQLLVHPDDWHIIRTKNNNRIAGVADSYLVRGKKRSGEFIWLRISGAPVTDKQGKVIGSVGILSDITASKQNEEAIRLQNAYLDELIEGAAEAIVILDMEDRVQRINKEFTSIFEYTPEEAMGERINDLIVPKDLQDEGWKATNDVAVGNKVFFETVRTSKSGKLIDVSVLGNPIKLDGKQVGVYGIYRDITNRVKLETQLRQSQRLDSIGQLAGGVAHDFNNMLTVILGYGEELLTSLGTDSPYRRELQEIIFAGKRAMNLTNQLLAFSRRQLIRPKILNLNDVVSEMSTMLHRLINEDIRIETNLAPYLANIKADTSQLEQVLLNLAVNARDAMLLGGVLSIETSNYTVSSQEATEHDNATPGNYVQLSISDTGTGMDKETLTHLFEPFFTTKDKSSSSGLGLATVYGIIKQAGGYIWVYSEQGHGSTFRILFPRCEEIASTSPKTAHGEATEGSGEHILVVEDEESLRNLIYKIITKLGYKVITVADAREAIIKVEEEGILPDLIITDVIMPEMNGKELADRLRLKYPKLKVLFMSGYTEDIIGHRGVLDRGIPFIQKPFTRNQIAEKIEQILHPPE